MWVVRYSVTDSLPVPLECVYAHGWVRRFVLHGRANAGQGFFGPPPDFHHDMLPVEALAALLLDGNLAPEPPVGRAFGLVERLLVRVEPFGPDEPDLFDRSDQQMRVVGSRAFPFARCSVVQDVALLSVCELRWSGVLI